MNNWLDRFLSLIGSILPAVLLAIVLIVVTANVIARKVLGIPFHIAHDLALVSFAGVVWFGVVGAAINGQLFGVAYFVNHMPTRIQRVAHVIVHLIVILIALAVIRAAIAQIETARFTRFLALGWPKWIVSAALLAAMVMLIFVQLRQAWIDIFNPEAGKD